MYTILPLYESLSPYGPINSATGIANFAANATAGGQNVPQIGGSIGNDTLTVALVGPAYDDMAVWDVAAFTTQTSPPD